MTMTTIKHSDIDNTQWIYESPDGGKTVTRRPINNFDPQYKDYKFGSYDSYMNYKTVNKLLEELKEEIRLRELHPILKEKWEEYKALVEICRDPKKDD